MAAEPEPRCGNNQDGNDVLHRNRLPAQRRAGLIGDQGAEPGQRRQHRHPGLGQEIQATNDFTAALEQIANGMHGRYDALERGEQPRPCLIIADEIQTATRDKANRQQIKAALMKISEQSGALETVA